jgi:hypothetical protein
MFIEARTGFFVICTCGPLKVGGESIVFFFFLVQLHLLPSKLGIFNTQFCDGAWQSESYYYSSALIFYLI